jgi:GT2 family glycosyltransferase
MSGHAPDVSIVIVSYNTIGLLRNCLRSIPESVEPFTHETIVVDNMSRDGSADMVEREFPEVRLIRAPRNLGFAGGNNAAFKLTRGHLVYCLNPDTVSHPGSLAGLIRLISSDHSLGYVGPKLLYEDGSHQMSAYRFHTPLSGFFSWSMLGLDRRFPRSRHCLSLHHLHGCDEPFEVDWLTGAAILTRQSVIEQVGGYDDGYFLYAEEIEWCWRMHRAGWRGRYEPSAVVTHIRAASTSHLDDAHAFHGHDPSLLIRGHRRLAVQTLGLPRAIVSQLTHLAGVSLAWLRNVPPLPGRNPATRRRAWIWMKYLVWPTASKR